MWKKTVMKQVAKMVPKNDVLFTAIAADNKDSNIEDNKDKLNGLELPVPARIAAKRAEKDDHAHDVPPTAHPVEEDGVTYEATNDEMPCSVCGQGMSGTDVDFCDSEGIAHTCADCRRKAEKPANTTAEGIIAKREGLKK
jgi:hypothetical protein